MTPTQQGDPVSPIKVYHKLLQHHNNNIIQRKASKYFLEDEFKLSILEEDINLKYQIQDIKSQRDSFGSEFDVNKSIKNTFRNRLLRRQSKLLDQANLTD